MRPYRTQLGSAKCAGRADGTVIDDAERLIGIPGRGDILAYYRRVLGETDSCDGE
ncbi:MAG: hypothetical protein QME60_06835 [Verrucomicrobiota bacterium]|nr:hypothetical protein [Verrucomicrobiota bacterium]